MKTLIQILLLTLLTIPLSQAQSYDELIKQGEDAFAAGDYNKSKEIFQNAVDLKPDGVVGIYALGYLMGATGEAQQGLQYLDKAISMAPNSTQFVLGRSEIKGFIIGDYEGAIKDLEFYKNHKNTKNPEVTYLNLIQFYVDSGNYSKAETYINKAEENIEELPNTFYYNKARFQSAEKQYALAIQSATKAINMNADWPMPYFTRAKALYSIGKYDKSVQDYDTYLKSVPNDDIAFSNRALAKEMSGDLNGALSDYSEAISLYDKDALTYLNRAATYQKLKNYNKALADLNKAASLNPKYPRIYNKRAAVYTSLNRTSDALKDYTTALNLDPDNVSDLISRSLCYLKLDKPALALTDAKKAIQLAPDNTDAYLHAGLASFNSNHYSTAVEYYTKGIAKNPEDGRLYYSRSAAYKELGNNSAAAADDSKAKALLTK